MTTKASPELAKPSRTAICPAIWAISSMPFTSSSNTECTPHANASRRAVEGWGVTLKMAASGRSRAARKLVWPDWVQQMMARALSKATARRMAQQTASATSV